MSTLQLTKTKMRQGIWEGIITDAGPDTPRITVTHAGLPVEGVNLTHDDKADHWLISVPVPPEAVADGVQMLVISDQATDQRIGHVTLIADEVLTDGLRAEVELLRAELDMLKRAFRRHCLETM